MSSYREEESYLIIPFLRAWIIFAPIFYRWPPVTSVTVSNDFRGGVPQASPRFPFLMQEEHAHTNESSPKKIKTTEDKLSWINGTCSCRTGQTWAQEGKIYREYFSPRGRCQLCLHLCPACRIWFHYPREGSQVRNGLTADPVCTLTSCLISEHHP